MNYLHFCLSFLLVTEMQNSVVMSASFFGDTKLGRIVESDQAAIILQDEVNK